MKKALWTILIISIATLAFFVSVSRHRIYNKSDTFTATSTVIFTAAGDYGATPDTARVLALIKKEAPVFNLALGDLSYNNIAPEKKWCDYIHASIGTIPFELISGNHEADGMNGFIEHFASCLPDKLKSVGEYSREYYFDYPYDNPIVRVILISPNLRFSNGKLYSYASTTSHYVWLENTIDTAHEQNIPWVILGMHEDCITQATKSCEIGTDVMKLAIDKKVDLILQGHDHVYERTFALTCINENSFTPNCIKKMSHDRYVKGEGSILAVVGTGGAPLYKETNEDPETPYFARFFGKGNNEAHGVLKVSATDEVLNAWFIKDDGTTLDTFSITK